MEDQIFNFEIDPWGDWLGSVDEFSAEDPRLQVLADFAQVSPSRNGTEECSDDIDASSLPSAEDITELLNKIAHTTLGSQEEAEAYSTDQTDRGSLTTCVSFSVPSDTSHSEQQFLPPAAVTPSDQLRRGAMAFSAGPALDPEMREAFLDDASVCMGAIEAAVMQLDDNNPSHEALIQISRNLHTLKGASASIGLSELADRLHELEEKLREEEAKGKAPPTALLLESLDWFRFQLSTFSGSSAAKESEPTGNQALLQPYGDSFSRNAPNLTIDASVDDDESVRVRTSQLNRLMDMLAELVMLRNRRQTEISDLREIYHEMIGSVSKIKAVGTQGNNYSSDGEQSQLTEVAADVLEVAHRLRACTRPVAEGNQAVSQFIRNFRQELVELRRSPAAGLFQRLKRAVHDAARAEEKIVNLECLGASTAIERSLQQRLFEPLLHIVRNAVCHGIEAAVVRKKAGKPAVGQVTLEVASTADLLVVEVRDDGGGLNYPAIRKKAIQSGLLTSDQSPSEQELAQLIFHPGFSTRESADRQAGRGIGMDVVAVTLQRLGGWFEVDSVAGQGTTIRLSIPLSSAIEHLMVFRVSGQLYAVPMLIVKHAGVPDFNSPCLQFSQILGHPLHEGYGNKPSLVIDWEFIQRSRASQSDSHPTRDQNSRSQINLIVDEIIGPEEVVIRPLPTLLRNHPFCSGATISGGGQLVLVLDFRRLASKVTLEKVDLKKSEPPQFDFNQTSHGRHLAQGEFQASLDDFQTSEQKRNEPQAGEAVSPSWSVCDSSPVADLQPVVLVVDDSVSSRKLVVRILNQYPLRVVEASDGRQALQLLKTHRFSAIFSDLEMPLVDGLELLSEVRTRNDICDTPFTIISSRTDSEIIEKAESMGVIRYLNKPVSEAALLSVLSEIETLAHYLSLKSQDSNSRN
jgi:chemosensory pili system protein ChpA (sensor histidine kinase/response regulator)